MESATTQNAHQDTTNLYEDTKLDDAQYRPTTSSGGIKAQRMYGRGTSTSATDKVQLGKCMAFRIGTLI